MMHQPFAYRRHCLCALAAALLTTAQGQHAQPTTCAFVREADGVYAIRTADLRLPRVLAHSDRPLRPDSDNPGYRWWLDRVERLAHCLDERGAAPDGPSRTDALRHLIARAGLRDSVAPLLTSRWGQEGPYNYRCPMADGSDAGRQGQYSPGAGHCPVGCVATATAQVMNFYKYPLRGTGTSHVEYPSGTSDALAFDADHGAACYDWAHTLDAYDGPYTDAEGDAVALLSYHVAVACGMDFGVNSSGSANLMAVDALKEHFGYDPDSLRWLARNEQGELIDNETYYERDEWMEMVYRELDAGRPILYEGIDINFALGIVGGHSFVLDGYDRDGRVHVNWGWCGQEDGYYDIDALDPRQYTFEEYQDMAIGIVPLGQGWTALPASAVTSRPHDSATVVAADGRRLPAGARLAPGVYVVDGRKVMVR